MNKFIFSLVTTSVVLIGSSANGDAWQRIVNHNYKAWARPYRGTDHVGNAANYRGDRYLQPTESSAPSIARRNTVSPVESQPDVVAQSPTQRRSFSYDEPTGAGQPNSAVSSEMPSTSGVQAQAEAQPGTYYNREIGRNSRESHPPRYLLPASDPRKYRVH
jgi:hypothetical protein